MANPLKKSLRIRLFITIFSASALVIGVLSAFAYVTARGVLQKQIFQNFVTIVESREQGIVLLLRNMEGNAKAYAKDWRIKDAVQRLEGNDPNAENIRKETGRYMDDLRLLNEGVDELFVLDRSGKIILSTEEKAIGTDKADDLYFIEGKKGSHIKDVHRNNISGKLVFDFSAPIYASESKELIGVVVFRYATATLNGYTTNRKGMGETGETYILNKDNLMITDSRFIQDVVLRQKVETKPVKVWREEKKEFTGIYPDYRGVPVVGSGMGEDIGNAFNYLDWVILVEVDAKEAFAPIQKLGFTLLLLGAILSILMAFIAYLIAQGIAKPITAMAQVVRRIGEGDLTQDITETKAEDEIGVLSKSFKQTLINLRNIVSQSKATAERVGAASQQLSATAQEMSATTEEMSSTVQQIAKGSEITAQKVEETSRVMEQMNASVTQVATSAQAAAAASVQATQSARKGGEAAKETAEKMNKIYETITASTEGVKKLGQRSEEINEIVNFITNISDQTNLLALNAAIEAARAGEAGRGFAVVAEEVRKLAEGSAKAADKIARLIKEVQKETAEAVKAMETGSKEVAEGREVVTKTGSALGEIIKLVENNASMVEQISAAAEQMSAGTKQVVKSVDEIAATAEEAASGTEEASASTEEMTASMQEMAASAQELSEMAISLRNMVGKFKVGDEASRQTSIPAYRQAGIDDGRQKNSALRERTEANKKKLEEMRIDKKKKT